VFWGWGSKTPFDAASATSHPRPNPIELDFLAAD
jgi:hypothetical protein